jgi:hypothetical protein
MRTLQASPLSVLTGKQVTVAGAQKLDLQDSRKNSRDSENRSITFPPDRAERSVLRPRTCLRYIYPCLAPGDPVFSHDGNFAALHRRVQGPTAVGHVGGPRPIMTGLGIDKLLVIKKPAAPA